MNLKINQTLVLLLAGLSVGCAGRGWNMASETPAAEQAAFANYGVADD